MRDLNLEGDKLEGDKLEEEEQLFEEGLEQARDGGRSRAWSNSVYKYINKFTFK